MAKVYLIDEHPPFLGSPPFPTFNPPLKKGGPTFLEDGETYIPKSKSSTLEGGPSLKKDESYKNGSTKGGSNIRVVEGWVFGGWFIYFCL